MKEKIQKLFHEIDELKAESKEHVEQLRIKYLSKKGELNDLFSEFKNTAPEQRKEVGQLLNDLKNHVQQKIETLKEEFLQNHKSDGEPSDLSLPADFMELGSRHPLSIVRNQIVNIFSHIGYTVFEGPEIEDDWHNFSALNFPEEHPARDMQDTFFIEKSNEVSKDIALRTHTSSVQARMMETHKPPMRAIFPGRVYRNEAISARSHCIFHQVEVLYIDKDVSFADLKQTLLYFAKEMFSPETQIRLRPSYFPFTEPSAEMDISCNICGGKGCNICKNSGWVEILGCGMVDPNVLENCGIDSKIYSGFAIGMGIERMTLVKYNINDIRLYFENDLRFLKQFASVI
jgi:phenylalanyl-tRNA synthetase alpha chain